MAAGPIREKCCVLRYAPIIALIPKMPITTAARIAPMKLGQRRLQIATIVNNTPKLPLRPDTLFPFYVFDLCQPWRLIRIEKMPKNRVP